MTIRLTGKTRRVLEAIHTLDQPWGLTICRDTGLGSGTVYPILDRLLRAGWIGSRVEATPPVGRPPRTFYHLTLRGQTGAGLEPTCHDMQEPGRAWMDGRLSGRDYFALARRNAHTPARPATRRRVWRWIWRRKG